MTRGGDECVLDFFWLQFAWFQGWLVAAVRTIRREPRGRRARLGWAGATPPEAGPGAREPRGRRARRVRPAQTLRKPALALRALRALRAAVELRAPRPVMAGPVATW